jgi:hypothetical protein
MRSDGKSSPAARVTGTESAADQVQDLTADPASLDREARLQIICALGRMGDARALGMLRERMSPVHQELRERLLSVSALKRRRDVTSAGESSQRAASFPCFRPLLPDAGGPS